MNYVNYVPQVDESDCGVAALAMVLKHYGSIYPLAKLRDMARTTKEGTTALGLVKAAQQLGLHVDAVQADLSLFDDADIKYPLIAHVVKQGLLHYYVIFKVDSDYVYIADPNPTEKVKKLTRNDFSKEWSGVALLFVPEDSYIPKRETLRGLSSNFKSLFEYRRQIVKIILAAAVVTIVGILNSYYLQLVIDDFIPLKDINILEIITIGLVIMYLLSSLLSYYRDYMLAKIGQNLSAKISLDFIQHVYKLPMRFFSTRKTGEITSRFNDINKIIDALASTIISIFLDAGMMVIIGVALYQYNLHLFLTTLLFLPIYVAIIYQFNRRFAKLDQDQMESNAILSSSIIEDLKGIETVKVLQLEESNYRRVSKQFADLLQKNLNYVKTTSFQGALKQFVQYTLTAMILFEGSIFVINNQLSIGTLMAYDSLLAFFINPLQNIASLQTKMQEARVANNRLNEVVQISDEQLGQSKSTHGLIGDIQLKDISYSYEYNQLILKNINLKIKDREKLAIVGMSGSGKSTLAKLLVGFYQPTQGQLLFNNNMAKQDQLADIRSCVHYLPQTPHLFSGTIRENLLLGSKKKVSQNEIDEACKKALIYDDIKALPLGYETKLDEEATSLSGGQRQRLTIARSLLSSAHVLIFDESTSSLDPVTEKQVVANLLSINNKTIIFIAHRLAIACKINNIVVMEKGKIIEQGTHRELLKKHKKYYELWNA